jgi:hypothetical protein
MRAAASGAGARARVGIHVGDCLGVHAQRRPSCLHPQAHALPPSFPLSLSCARGSILTRHSNRDANRSIRKFPPGSIGAGLSGRGASSAQPPFEEAEPAAVQTEAELATMNKMQRWARAGHANKKSETDAFSSRAAVACRYPAFVLQMVPKQKPTRWILQTDPHGLKTDPSAYNAFGSCRRILQRSLNLDLADGSSRATCGSSRA